jgi:hypothetical protein
MIPDQREWQKLNENNEPSGASQNILDFAARLSVELDTRTPPSPTWAAASRSPIDACGKGGLAGSSCLFTVSSWQARPWRRRASPLSHKTIVAAKVSVDIDGVPKGAAFQRTACHSPNENPAQGTQRGGVS